MTGLPDTLVACPEPGASRVRFSCCESRRFGAGLGGWGCFWTLSIEFRDVPVVEPRDLDENTLLDLDARGDICAMTVEHASERAGIRQFSYEQVTAVT